MSDDKRRREEELTVELDLSSGQSPPGAVDGEPSLQAGDSGLPCAYPEADGHGPGRRDRPGAEAWLTWVFGLLLVLLVGAAALFVIQAYLPLVEERESLQQELSEAETENAGLREQVGKLDHTQAELEETRKQLAEQLGRKEAIVADLQKAKEALSKELAVEMKKGEVMIEQSRGQLVVDLVDKIMFETAEVELNDRGKEVLKRVAVTLAKLPDKVIQIGGHTDSVPISAKLVEQFPTNWELSAARATNVVRFLQDECKIPGERLTAVGLSQYRPVASNRSRRGRRRNRRIEVVLLPRPEGKAKKGRRR